MTNQNENYMEGVEKQLYYGNVLKCLELSKSFMKPEVYLEAVKNISKKLGIGEECFKD